MDVKLAEYSDRRRWDDYVLSCPDATAYHLFAWRDAVEGAYGFPGLYLMATERNRICGVFPLFDFHRSFLSRRLVSLPFCDCGGVLADDAAVAGCLVAEARSWSRSLRASGLEIRTTKGFKPTNNTTDRVRMVLPLPDSSSELLANMKAKLRSQVKKPQRDGFRGVIGGDELLEMFYDVWSVNMRDLGSPAHSFAWFRQIFASYEELARVGVVFSPVGAPAAAGIILTVGNCVTIPWASSLQQLNHLNPNMLLYWTLLAFAADRGYRYFDFGRSKFGGGTYRFKKQWGAQPHQLEWIFVDNSGGCEPLPAVKSVLRSPVEAAWRHLPLSCCNLVGPLIRKNISL